MAATLQPTEQQIKEFNEYLEARRLWLPPLPGSDLPAIESYAAPCPLLEDGESDGYHGDFDKVPTDYEGMFIYLAFMFPG